MRQLGFIANAPARVLKLIPEFNVFMLQYTVALVVIR